MNKKGKQDADVREEEKEETPIEEPQVDETDSTKDVQDDDSPKTIAELEAELAESRKRISELNQESADRRKKLKAFEEAEEARKREAMSELERAQADAKKALEQAQQLASENRRLKVQQSVTGKPFTFGEKEYILIDPEDFTLPDDADLEAIPEHLEELFKVKPHYFKEPGKAEVDPDEDPGTPRSGKKRGGKRETQITLPRMKL